MKNQRGFLIIVALVMILIFGLLGAALVHMFISTTSSITNIQAYNKAWSLAQSGVEEGLYQLYSSNAVCNGSPQATSTLATGQYQYVCPSPTPTLSALAAGLDVAANTITLTDATLFGFSGSVRVGNEIIFYSNKVGNNLNGLRRGARNTIASSHTIGAIVYQNQYLISGQGSSSSFAKQQGAAVIEQGLEFVRFFAADTAGQFYIYNGTNWSKTFDNVSIPINTITCIKQNCFAGGGDGSVYVYNFSPYSNNGAVWIVTPEPTRGFISSIKQIGCVSTNKCYAVGESLKIIAFDGISWAPSLNPLPHSKLEGISCANNLCKAVGNYIKDSTNNHTKGLFLKEETNWNSPFEPAFGEDEIMTISCINTMCTVGGKAQNGGGKFYIYNANTDKWTSALTPPNVIRKIYCIDATHCHAVGEGGNFYSFNGVTWGLVQTIGSSTLYDLTCTDLNHCYAVGDGGNFYFYNGTNWVLSQNIGTTPILSISNAIIPAITLTNSN